MLHLGRSDNTVTFFIQMHMHHIALSFLHLHFLLTERHEQVFHQSPVKKGAELIDPCHLQTGKFTHLYIRLQRSSDQTFLHIEVDKYIQNVSRLGTFGHITFRKQDFTVLISIEVHAKVHFLHYFQLIIFP